MLSQWWIDFSVSSLKKEEKRCSVTTQRCQLRKHCASVVLWSAGVATRIVSLGVATVSDSRHPRKNLIGRNTDHGELTYILQYLHINVVLVL